MSKDIYTTYLGRVADILKRTDHPRQNEVLEDLQIHLEELETRGQHVANIDELIALLGSPEEYAENLVPATGYRPKPWYRQRRLHRIAIASIVAILVYMIFIPDVQTVKAHIRKITGINANTNPFFDLKKAMALQPGATAQEIRDAIGIPIDRYALKGLEDEMIWDYTGPCYDAPFYTGCRIITSATTLCLLRVEVNEPMLAEPMVRGNTPYCNSEPTWEKIGKLRLSCFGKQKLVLTPHDKRPTIIIPVWKVDPKDIYHSLQERKEWITKSWKNVNEDAFRFVYLLAAEDLGQHQKAIENISPELPIYSDVSLYNIRWKTGYSAFIYKNGILYGYPIGFSRSTEYCHDDQNWLIHRMLSETE